MPSSTCHFGRRLATIMILLLHVRLYSAFGFAVPPSPLMAWPLPSARSRGRGYSHNLAVTEANEVELQNHWSGDHGVVSWITLETAERAAKDLHITTREFEDRYADVEAYTSCDDEGDGIHKCSIVDDFLHPTKWLHLRPEAQGMLDADFILGTETEDDVWNQPHSMIAMADTVAKETVRWCDGFVAKSDVSPWVKPSFIRMNEIRFKVVPASFGLEGLEDAVREASHELLRGDLQYNNGRKQHEKETSKSANDARAFTFVVCAPERADAYVNPQQSASSVEGMFLDELDFESFIGFALDLEEKLLAEAEEHYNDPELSNFVPISDSVTMIPFHPHWQFACSPGGVEIGSDCSDDPLINERMSPYPTILLVRTSDL